MTLRDRFGSVAKAIEWIEARHVPNAMGSAVRYIPGTRGTSVLGDDEPAERAPKLIPDVFVNQSDFRGEGS
jgi:hypothetical protein